jgi:hypothetical protein
MPFKYQPIQPGDPADPVTSRDIRFGVNLGQGELDTGRLGDLPNELNYSPARDQGPIAGSPDPISFVTSLPFRGIGAVGSAVGGAMAGVSDFLNGIGPVKAYGETVGQPVGDVGKTLLDWIGGPGRFVADMAGRARIALDKDSLPSDIKNLIDGGADQDRVLEYMRETNRSFSNDAMVNLGASILLDPLNFTPFIAGKVALAPALAKVAGFGAGAAAGSLAGGVGAIAGGAAGFKAGTKAAQNLPKLQVGLDLGRKIRLTQARMAAGKDLGSLAKYAVIANIHKGLFGKINGISDGIKAAFAVKAYEVGERAYGSGAWDVLDESAKVFGEDTSGIAQRRASIGFQQSAFSVVRDKVVGGVDEVAKGKTDTFIADINEARKQIIEEGGYGNSEEIAQFLISKTRGGQGVSSKYGVSEFYLESEVSAYLDAKGAEFRGGTRYLNADREVDVWSARRNVRLANSAMEDLARGRDWQREGVDFATSHSEALARGMADLQMSTVTREASLVGMGDSGLVSELLVDPVRALADDLARAKNENLSNAGKLPRATDEQFGDFVSTWTEGGTVAIVNGKQRIVGGKFFDEQGIVKSDPVIRRQLAQRMAWANHVRFGFAVNRVGNIRRLSLITAGFATMPDAQKVAVRKEITRLTGRSLTDAQLNTLGEMKNASVTRMTLLRNDSLLDTEVDRFLKGFALLDNAELNASDLVSVGFSEDIANKLVAITYKDAGKTVMARKRALANNAVRQFADLRNQVTMAKGSVDPQQVIATLEEAARSGATFSVAKQTEVQQLKAFWASIGGSPEEIDNIIAASRRSGYRIGIAPADNMMRIPTRVAVRNADGTAQTITVSKAEPYVDITSDFVDGMPNFNGKYNRGFFTSNLRKLFSPVMQSQITSSARQRLIVSLGAYFTPDEITQFDSLINEQAASKRIGVRGLVNAFGNKSDIYNAMDTVLKDRGVVGGLESRLKEATSAGLPKLDIDNALLKAYAGEIGTSGVTQWITGQVKANGIPGVGMNKFVAQMTENFYPTLKYAANPFFWLQEIVESPFFKEARGIRTDEVTTALRKAGLEPQDVRIMLGERDSAIAQNMHEASFGTAVASRGGLPTTLKPGLEEQSIVGVVKSIYRRKRGDASPVEVVASYKESQRDIMAAYEYAQRWAKDTAKTRPAEYAALADEFGTNELDMFAGWLSRYRRAVDLGWGDDIFDYARPANWGFAVSPSEVALARSRQEVDAFASYLDDNESISFLLAHKPSDLTRIMKLKVVDEARQGGYDVQRLAALVDDVEVAALKLRQAARGVSPENFKTLKEYKALRSSIAAVKEESVYGLGSQIFNSKTNELILRRLYEKVGVSSATGPAFDVVVKALANGRRYGAKFNSLGAVTGEIFDRIAANSTSFRGLTEAEKITRIDAIINNVMSGDGLLAQSAERIGRTLHDSAITLLNDHATEELAFQAAKFRYQETARAMDRINYFNPDRNFLERTMNHQFLGLYPLSYMFGKVLPETFRFMFWKPFGALAPGAGFQAYRKFIDYLSQNGFIPDFEKRGTERPDYLFFLTQLIPGTPEDITVGLPGWMRRGMSTISRQGYDQLTADQMVSEIGKPLVDTGVIGAGRTIVKSLQEITGMIGGPEESITQDIPTLR